MGETSTVIADTKQTFGFFNLKFLLVAEQDFKAVLYLTGLKK